MHVQQKIIYIHISTQYRTQRGEKNKIFLRDIWQLGSGTGGHGGRFARR